VAPASPFFANSPRHDPKHPHTGQEARSCREDAGIVAALELGFYIRTWLRAVHDGLYRPSWPTLHWCVRSSCPS